MCSAPASHRLRRAEALRGRFENFSNASILISVLSPNSEANVQLGGSAPLWVFVQHPFKTRSMAKLPTPAVTDTATTTAITTAEL